MCVCVCVWNDNVELLRVILMPNKGMECPSAIHNPVCAMYEYEYGLEWRIDIRRQPIYARCRCAAPRARYKNAHEAEKNQQNKSHKTRSLGKA